MHKEFGEYTWIICNYSLDHKIYKRKKWQKNWVLLPFSWWPSAHYIISTQWSRCLNHISVAYLMDGQKVFKIHDFW